MSFTRNEMLRYYVVKTDHVCLHCEKVTATTVSAKIMVEYLDSNNKPASIPLTSLIERYVRMHEYRIDSEEAFARIPLLPFETKTFEEPVKFCKDCLPIEFGSDEPNAFPTMLPAPQKISYGPVESEQVPLEPTKGKPTSKKIKRETQEQRQKRERLAAIKRGDISSLL